MRKRNEEVMPHGAEIIETDELLLTERSLSDVTANSRIGAFVGASGTGKTFSVREIVDGMEDVEVVWLEFESRPTILHLARVIYSGLFDDDPPSVRNSISNAIILGLSRNGRKRKLLLVVDEAQRLNTECIEYLRYLHDHVGTGFSLAILGGDGAWSVIRKEPMLLSRIYRRVTFKPMDEDTVLKVLPNYHSMYDNMKEEFITQLNEYLQGHLPALGNRHRNAESLMAEQNAETGEPGS